VFTDTCMESAHGDLQDEVQTDRQAWYWCLNWGERLDITILLDTHFTCIFFIYYWMQYYQSIWGRTNPVCSAPGSGNSYCIRYITQEGMTPPWDVCQGRPNSTRPNADNHSILYRLGTTMKGAHCYISRTLILWYYVKGCLFYIDLLIHLKVIKTLF
jgi:hypothetical protein